MAEIDDRLANIEKSLKKLTESSSRETPHKRDIVKEMRESGFGLFNSEGKKVLNMIATRYAGNFLTYFLALEEKYRGSAQTAEATKVKDVRQKIGDLSGFIDKLRTGAISADPVKDIQKLRQSIEELDGEFEFFTNSERLSTMMSESLAAVEQSTGISIAELKYAQGLFGRKIQQISKPPSRFPELKEYGVDILKGLGYSAFVPFVPFIEQARKAYRGGKERKETLQNFAFENASVNRGIDAPEPSGVPESFPSVSSVEEKKAGGGTRATVAGSTLHTASVGAEDALFAFFNGRAADAKWTKNLLEAVTKQPEKEKGGGGGGGGDILGALSKVPWALLGTAAAGLTGLGMGAWDAYKGVQKSGEWFGYAPGEKVPIGQKVAAGVGGFLGGTGPGIGEEGSTWGGVGKQALWGAAKGAGIGAGVGSIIPVVGTGVGAAVGGAIGGLGGLLGGERAAKAAQAYWRMTPMGMGQEAWRWWKERKARKEMEAGGGGGGWGDEEAGSTADISSGGPSSIKVPIDTAQADLQRLQKEGMDKLRTSVDEMKDAVKESGKGRGQARPSGYDANNTRHPMMSGVVAGYITD